jgi:hypothetical protein
MRGLLTRVQFWLDELMSHSLKIGATGTAVIVVVVQLSWRLCFDPPHGQLCTGHKKSSSHCYLTCFCQGCIIEMDGQVQQVGAVYNVAPDPACELRWIRQWSSKTSRGWRSMLVVV